METKLGIGLKLTKKTCLSQHPTDNLTRNDEITLAPAWEDHLAEFTKRGAITRSH
ncbi:hypothetical protein O9992_27150 [Vibrio lentus]|nr:hypothetical protein [Vibrio lentus]